MRDQSVVEIQIDCLRHRRIRLQAYAADRFAIGDRHGVQDAMSDLRELDAVIEALSWVLKLVPSISR